jgi:hypothetical protein
MPDVRLHGRVQTIILILGTNEEVQNIPSLSDTINPSST